MTADANQQTGREHDDLAVKVQRQNRRGHEQLRSEGRWQSVHTAKTLAKYPDFRVVLIAMKLADAWRNIEPRVESGFKSSTGSIGRPRRIHQFNAVLRNYGSLERLVQARQGIQVLAGPPLREYRRGCARRPSCVTLMPLNHRRSKCREPQEGRNGFVESNLIGV